jgi:hypothetical protein
MSGFTAGIAADIAADRACRRRCGVFVVYSMRLGVVT